MAPPAYRECDGCGEQLGAVRITVIAWPQVLALCTACDPTWEPSEEEEDEADE